MGSSSPSKVDNSNSNNSGGGGSYDHSAEYDPYQSAARQMQELLFGSNGSAAAAAPPGGGSSNNNAASSNSGNDTGNSGDLRPSTNSAFQKYVPSTSDINTKMNSKTSFSSETSPYITAPRRSDSLKGTLQPQQQHLPQQQHQSWESLAAGAGVTSPKLQHVNFNPLVSSSLVGKTAVAPSATSSSNSRSKSPKVARFCHECGNPFALPNIRFCCECGVKRLYC